MTANAAHYDVIRKPIITEKTPPWPRNGAVVFEVAIDANKPQIKQAVEEAFRRQGEGRQHDHHQGKTKRFRGQRAAGRTVQEGAYVTLEEGNTIDVRPSLIDRGIRAAPAPTGAVVLNSLGDLGALQHQGLCVADTQVHKQTEDRRMAPQVEQADDAGPARLVLIDRSELWKGRRSSPSPRV